MSCEDYCPERDNDYDEFGFEELKTEEAELISNKSRKKMTKNEKRIDDLRKKNGHSEYKAPELDDTMSQDKFDKQKEIAEKINDMIKSEVKDKFGDNKTRKSTKEFEKLNDKKWFDSLTEIEKIKEIAVAFNRTGGINLENILELKMLMVLIGATEQMEGFEDFPREAVYKLLEMTLYHANKHLEHLDV